ncbi:multicomponent K+:H+ antiporter subunit E [Mesorhizobium soli]|jgi:multicomponent K+:H+ antiporter subunit E|uniref:Na+/H+ antiporter subunit E n=1 Tax=Pseudaminobacter soli (ex Li et al. 2025) TaxID=1295366 RepID=UPI00247571EF|nr:Na+/H+ antiporter subunit E [Mesorhizobium soli]MDH6233935.1 multicomponent K+:H+ antiporter subunit E [Mesorhizobium soli]
MMRSVLPYPLLALSLLVMWILLNGLSVGQLLLGGVVAVAASAVMAQLKPAKPRLRNWRAVMRLALILPVDIFRSNMAVSRQILAGTGGRKISGFVAIPLALRDRTGLAILACIITSTPGTAWVEYDSNRNTLLLHVLDLGSEDWIKLIKTRYEQPLMEIFG